jgi:multiple sugar transport system substrate-binding protein
MNLYKTTASCAMLLALLAAAGCSSDTPKAVGDEQANTAQAEKPPEPVTVKFAAHGSQLPVEDFEKYFKVPVSKKYPHITIERIDHTQKGTGLTELIAAREIPDIYMNGPLDLATYFELGLENSIDDLIKTNKFDMTRIKPEVLSTMTDTLGRKDLIGVPWYNQGWAILYNKDLFDKMAAAYPKDNMTWEEIGDLGSKFKRTEGGISYYGLAPSDVFRGAYQLRLPWVDVQANKSMLLSPGWKEVFELYSGLHDKAGLVPKGSDTLSMFTKGNIAMIATSATRARLMRTIQGLSWDAATYPQMKNVPGYGHQVDPSVLLIPKGAKNRDAAFKVISVVLSDEVQRDMSRNVWVSVLDNQSIQDEFGKEYPDLNSKNMAAFTKLKRNGTMPSFGGVNAIAIANNALTEILYDGKDSNTALREADDKLNKALEERKQQKK